MLVLTIILSLFVAQVTSYLPEVSITRYFMWSVDLLFKTSRHILPSLSMFGW